ncbi:MAG: chromosome segregation protein SMC [Cocleimonas sp.]
MRLSKIKIAGFKSFVDPTTIDLRSSLTGVVGPNGCGKSNVIDAVRWVMGESSAKHLRGASMDDVIFNGSAARQPIGQAAIELIFDNSDSTLGGEYAEFSEIGIKRLITRDGQSKYFLNGSRCRRRDITDIFLGTGLGPRSYAIIEQGMISRLIEAKPEELRNTLEEAAGISKYKDRRRETERRIKNTRENLDRLSDLREELEKQLSHLDRQAKAAVRFKTLKQEERQTSAELILLRLKNVDEDINERQNIINENANTHQSALAEQRSLENQIESQRSQQTQANDTFNEVQASFYQVGAEISRLEQTIQHQKELAERHQRELTQVDSEISAAQQHADADKTQLQTATEQLTEFEPLLTTEKQELESANTKLNDAEAKLTEWQQSWNSLQIRLAEPAQQAQVERARMEQLEKQLQQVASHLLKLNNDKGIFNTESHTEELSQQQQLLSDTKQQSSTIQTDFDKCKQDLQTQIETNRESQQQLQDSRSELQSLSGKLSSLEVLQRAGLGKDKNSKSMKRQQEWLRKHGLDSIQPLAETIQIESGWEKALEIVLGDFLQSKQLDSKQQLENIFKGELPSASSTFIFNDDKAPNTSNNSLAAKVSEPKAIQALLSSIQCAETLEDGLQQQSNLKAGETLITKDGMLLGSNWLKTQAQDSFNQQDGVLARKKEIEATKKRIDGCEVSLKQHQQTLDNGQQQRKQFEEQQGQLQTRLNELHREESQAQSVIHANENRIKQTEANQQRVLTEIIDLELQQTNNQEFHQNATKLRNQALQLLESLESEKNQIEGKEKPLQQSFFSAKEQARLISENVQQAQLKVEAAKTSKHSAQQQLNRLDERLSMLNERKNNLITQNSNQTDDTATEQNTEQLLAQQLEQRKTVEIELSKARENLQTIDNAVRELDQKRSQAEQTVEKFRSLLENLKMEWQEVSVRQQTLKEQFDETEFNADDLLQKMDDEISLDKQKTHLEDIQRKVARLGAINLAAIEEFKTQNERKIYLDQQDADLMEALETLETAIAKIDRDTRSRFKDTFEKVNTRIQEMFPQLFGGGRAHLEMTGDDLLTTGISIMAQPPGKRISSIHLMSGGEKALTAVALVFAIFELNPAPFCMLDEVDAPLDEANVGRFCQLVKKMSDRVQFIFITHNKTTMELAENLIGVTMREPGISRLVSVDVNEAARMANE